MSSSDNCPTGICGVWTQDASRCQSLCPLLEGLGLPRSLLWAACPIVDATRTTLRISCPEQNVLEIVDKTNLFGRNSTRLPLDGTEVEARSKGRGKQFNMSLTHSEDKAVVTCRLVSRGPGWNTRQERFVLPGGSPGPHGEGTTMCERHVLTRPGEPDIVIDRHFTKTSEQILPPEPGASQ